MVSPRFKPRIDDRHDKAVFLLAFCVGALMILLIRSWGADARLDKSDFAAVIAAVGVIVLYTAYILVSANRSSISLDRAGDNAYYLGLLFTLVSLGYSLWRVSALIASQGAGEVPPADRVLDLLPDFGLALSSTIAGILARVIVQQFRNEPTDIEAETRRELGRAVQDLRDSLVLAVTKMNDASLVASTAMAEMSRRTNQTIENSANASTELVSRLAQKAEGCINEFSAQIQPAGDSLSALAQEVAAATEQIKKQSAEVGASSASVQRGLESAVAELENLRRQMDETKKSGREFAEALRATTDGLSKIVPTGLTQQLEGAGNDALARLRRLVASLEETESGLSQLGEKLNGIGERVSGAAEEQRQQLASQLGTIANEAERIKQKLGEIEDRAPAALARLQQVETSNQAIASQLKEASSDLEGGQQRIRSELDSLRAKILETGASLDRAMAAQKKKGLA